MLADQPRSKHINEKPIYLSKLRSHLSFERTKKLQERKRTSGELNFMIRLIFDGRGRELFENFAKICFDFGPADKREDEMFEEIKS